MSGFLGYWCPCGKRLAVEHDKIARCKCGAKYMAVVVDLTKTKLYKGMAQTGGSGNG